MGLVIFEDLGKWDKRGVDLAQYISCWSKDPSTQVGAAILRTDNTVAGVGYNGLPRGVIDNPLRLFDRDSKYPMTVHAEINALANSSDYAGGTLFVWPLLPCPQCAAAIIQFGIKRVVAHCAIPATGGADWLKMAVTSAVMFGEAGVEFIFAFDNEMRLTEFATVLDCELLKHQTPIETF